jgi:hypothetical protein
VGDQGENQNRRRSREERLNLGRFTQGMPINQ